MTSLFKYISSFFSQEKDVMSQEEALAVLNEAKEKDPEVVAPNNEVPQNACYHRRGKITVLKENCGIIDNNLYFREIDTEGLEVGMEVNYLAYDINGETKVSKILSPVISEWKENEDKMSFWYKKTMISQVIERDGRTIISTPDIVIDLNTVHSEFVPIVGDWLQLEALVEADQAALDFAGSVLEVTRISPVSPNIIEGTIKIWNGDTKQGQINLDVYFNGDSLCPGYMPVHNDKVVAEIIESEQGRCIKRALKVVPNTTNNKNTFITKSFDTKFLVKNKNGIEITDQVVVTLKRLRELSRFEMEVKNTSRSTHKLIKAEFQSKQAQSQLRLLWPHERSFNIDPDQTVVFKFSCLGRFMGTTQELFMFTFVGFEIGRWVTIKINPEVGDQVRSYAAKTQKNIVKLASESMLCKNKDILLGQKPIKPPSFIANKLPVYEVPAKLMEVVFKQMETFRCLTDIPIESIAPCLKSNLTLNNYENRFHTLLYLEEIALQINMHKYDMKCTNFTKNQDFLMLEVNDLSERKPSVIIGDRVIASNIINPVAEKYEGFVHKIAAKHVYIKFHPSFHNSYRGEDYMVEFHFSRSSFRRYHQAINLAVRFLRERYLFPSRLETQDVQLIFQCEDDEQESNNSRTLSFIQSLKNNSSTEEKDPDDSVTRGRTSLSSSFKEVLKNRQNNSINSETNDSVDDSISDASSSENSTLHESGYLSKLRARKMQSNGIDSETTKNTCDTTDDNKTTTNNYMKVEKNEFDNSDTENKPDKSIDESQTNKFIKMLRNKKLSADKQLDVKTLIKTCPVKLKWYNRSLNKNQKQAVINILKGEARTLPYIIFGPPGTGKTITLIESTLQILRMLPHSRLLITAPSNSAADLLALRLLDSGVLLPGDLVRMVAFRCVMEGSIPERLRPYCVTADIAKEGSQEQRGNLENGIIVGQYASALGRHRVTVGTCMIVGSFYTMGFPRGHFTHVFIDEAGQATEPETMIPLSLLDPNNCQVILAGDPRQLGPCVFSLLSSSYGLSESYLERLITRFPYARDSVGFPTTGGYDPRLVTKLVLSYRSLPDILELPNLLFYNSELKSLVSPVDSDEARMLQRLDGLLLDTNGPPPAVIFHGVRGENYQMADSPSWFNSAEASQVFFYVNDLYDKGISPKDIGIISPYVKQCQQVRALLLESGLPLPKVGSVEEFQGQEFKIVIVTTVRSNETGARRDSKLELGFIASPRRVNVAISRAQALLIIVGNPHLLSTDSTWRSVLMYAIKIGGYVGCDLPNFKNI